MHTTTIIDELIYADNDVRITDEAAKHSLEIANAGGASNISEALSMQHMHDVYGASDFVPEMEVPYWVDYKKMDYLAYICMDDTGGEKERVGVSVTRAISYPFDREYDIDSARILMEKKMYGLIVARQCVVVVPKEEKEEEEEEEEENGGFEKSFLHVWCPKKTTADLVVKAFCEVVDADAARIVNQRKRRIVDDEKEEEETDLPTYSDVSLMCTICSAECIYTNRRI
jgi:hypothetical protein